MPSSLSGGIGIGIGEFGSRLSSSALPTPPVPGPSLWLRGDDAPNSSGMGLAVPLWKDVSGNGNDATQAVVASQPTGISNQINGHAAVVPDGVNDFMSLVNGFTNPCTVLAVYSKTGSDDTNILCGPTSSMEIASLSSLKPRINNHNSQNLLQANSVDSGFVVRSFVVNNPNFAIYLNGNQDGTSTVSSTFSQLSNVLFSDNVPSGFFSGKIAEILIYPTALSDADRQTVQAYLGTKYAIAIGLPQISLFDFSGLTGANFVTASAGLYVTLQVHNGPTDTVPWFNTGTETAPNIGSFSYIEVGCSPTDTAQNLATNFATAMTANLGGSLTVTVVDGSAGAGSLTAVQITDKQTGPVTPATAGNSGVAVSVTQTGAGNS